MAIADLAPTPPRKGPTCDTCVLLAQLDHDTPTEAEALRRLLADPKVRYTQLAVALEGEGITISHGSLGRHARGACEARERLRA